MNTPQLQLVGSMVNGATPSKYTPAVHAQLTQAMGKPIMNTPSTAVQVDPTQPTIDIPGVGTLQPNASGTAYNHVVVPNAGMNNTVRKVPFVGTNVKYQYDILAKRVGVNFGTLGYVIGALDELNSAYATPLSLIPSNQSQGLTVTVAFVAGNLVFNYTDGVHTDQVILSCSQMPMANLLQKLQIKKWSVPTTRCSFSDEALSETQFSVSILKYKRKESGGVITDPLSFIANQTPYQLTIQKVDVNASYDLSREEGFAGAMIADNNAVLTHSIMMEEAQAYAINQ
jgi:hypothetical protein